MKAGKNSKKAKTDLLLVSLNPYLEKMMIANILLDKDSTVGKIVVIHCGPEEVYHQVFENAYYSHLDEKFGLNMSRDVYASRVDLIQIQDSARMTKVLSNSLDHIDAAIFDSHSQKIREGQTPSYPFYARNSILLEFVDHIVLTKTIRKKLFINYPFNIYQTGKEDATADILEAISVIKRSDAGKFKEKIDHIHKEFKINIPVIYSSLFQVYLREQYATDFFFIEVPYLIPGIDILQGLYLTQGNILDELIVFMRDGMINVMTTPINSVVPIIPIDLCCRMLLQNLSNSSALIGNFHCCLLKWQDFFYIVSDHFTIHSPSYAYAGPEIKAYEKNNKTSISLVANRIPEAMLRKSKNYSLHSFLKELQLVIRFSTLVDRTPSPLDEGQWKQAIDDFIYGVRRYYLNDKTNKFTVYNKYGILRNRYQFRKQSFLHWGFLKGKVGNVSEFDSSIFAHRVQNCRRLHDSIQEDMAHFISTNPYATTEELTLRRKMIDKDVVYNLGLLSTHFKKVGLMGLSLGCHYMFRRMFDGIIFDNSFTEFVRNHDYRRGPIIFLPTHKSYMDFMILSYLLVMRDARPPLIGAADNMNNIAILSTLFKMSGAFYIKRTGQRFPKVYRAVLNEFMKSVLENEMNMEFFMEATRSRTGQVLFPKFGMLKYVVEAFLEKRIPDVYMIPLNVTYENLIEADSYIGEHRGGQRVGESTMRTIKSISLINRNYGRIIINSAKPISLRNYVDWYAKGKPERDVAIHVHEDQFVQELGLYLTNVLQEKSVFMHTHLVCAILLMRHHYQLVKDVESSVRMLSAQIKARNGTIFEIEENEFNFETAVKCFKNRLSIRGDTFNEKRVCVDRTNYLENCLSLKYYANSMNYLFFIEAVLYFSASNQYALEKTVELDKLWNKVSLLLSVFKKEIFLMEIPRSKEEMISFIKQKDLAWFKFVSSQDGEVINDLPKEELLVIEFYNILIPPIFAGYMIAFTAILKFNTEEPFETERFIHLIQHLAETCHNMGVIQSPSFCSIFYTRQAYLFLLDKGILVDKPTVIEGKVKKCYVVNNRPALKLILQNCRSWFLWDENYKIVKRVFEDKYLKELMEEVKQPEEPQDNDPELGAEPHTSPIQRQRL